MKSRRSEILRTGYDLVGNEGLESLHARTVAAKMGLNHATIHYYFPKRVDLLKGVAEFALEQFRADRAKIYEGLNSADDKLEAELALAEAYCKKQSRFAKVVLGLYTASIESTELKKPVAGIFAEWKAALEEVLSQAKLKRGTQYRDAEFLCATLFGFMCTAQLDPKFDGREKIDALFDSLVA